MLQNSKLRKYGNEICYRAHIQAIISNQECKQFTSLHDLL